MPRKKEKKTNHYNEIEIVTLGQQLVTIFNANLMMSVTVTGAACARPLQRRARRAQTMSEKYTSAHGEGACQKFSSPVMYYQFNIIRTRKK